ncbi:MAG TPA: DUF6086 family protein [Micromonospora sp.]|nr:DUF6086 family protein [Micromonospora sp.]
MSQYFCVGGTCVWNSSTRVAQLFFETAGAMVVVARRHHGIRDLGHDEYDIDLPTYQEFLQELTRWYLESSHKVFASLIEGFLPAALALLRKAGGDVPLLAEAAARDLEKALYVPGGRSAIMQAERMLARADDLASSISA